jgi:23S rRNA pseudouridine1911/1915/1917 synthase
MKFSSCVPVNVISPQPVVEYLAQRFTYHSHADWVSLINSGKICIDGRTALPQDTIVGKQTVEYDAGEFDEPPADLGYTILYEDQWLLAVNKPGNLLIHRAGRSFRNNLMYQLRSAHVPPYPGAHSIHRLDRNTSGIVLVAKSSELLAEIADQFRKRTIHKWYDAIVEGIPSGTVERIELPIGKDNGAGFAAKFRIDESGKEAVTLVERCTPAGTGCAHLVLRPLTGRTHQLRVHCAAIGHPIIGDQLYGSSVSVSEKPAENPDTTGRWHLPQRHALHCGRIVFHHPAKNEECCIEAPLPEEMQMLLQRLSGLP